MINCEQCDGVLKRLISAGLGTIPETSVRYCVDLTCNHVHRKGRLCGGGHKSREMCEKVGCFLTFLFCFHLNGKIADLKIDEMESSENCYSPT